jgi:hypothetical protein
VEAAGRSSPIDAFTNVWMAYGTTGTRYVNFVASRGSRRGSAVAKLNAHAWKIAISLNGSDQGALTNLFEML